MDRNITFRGVCKSDCEWVYGGVSGTNHSVNDEVVIISNEFVDGDEENEHLIMIEVIPETVTQYTGKIDKRGNMVFDGDIVIERLLDACEPKGYYDCKSVVELVQGCWVLSQIGFDYSNTPLHERHFLFESNDIEIVGNIHEKEVSDD